jgi:uncharacterized protein YhaN
VRINGLDIDGYGIWTGLKLQGLSDGLNVLYGPNEAGKTTLLQFIRSVLYGFSPARQRYFPPLRGGRPGGSIDLAAPSGRFQLRRHHDASGAAGNQEQLALIAADGTLQGEHLVKTLLCDVDEAIYSNVFAVGLREMQQLGTLSDTQAAELLYKLTAGLDRVSLVEVMRELRTSRNRILDEGGGPCQVGQLLDSREKLRLEIEELGKLTPRYQRLAAEQNQLQREAARLEEESHQTDHQARVVELAITLRDRWMRRAALDGELAALGPSATMPPGAVDRLDALNARLQRHQELAEEARCRREQLRAEAAGLAVNEALWRQAARIEALQEQRPWITTLQTQVGELEAEIAQLQSGLAAEQQQLGLGHPPTGSRQAGTPAGPETWAAISAPSLARLRSPARAIKHCRRRIGEARRQVAAAGQNAETLSGQIAAAVSQRGQSDLAAALDGAGHLVSQLRRRVQIDERLDQMTLYQTELEEQSRRLLDRQLLPVWVLLVLGAVFVVGVVLVMAGLFMPTSITGSVGWAMALLGLAGSGAAGTGKVMLERSHARQLESCQRQINMLQLQVRQTKEERDALDGQLPCGGLPAQGHEASPSEWSISGRLQAAEKELAGLEELLPLDARRSSALQEARVAAGRLAQIEEELATARRRWGEALSTAGLPAHLTPKQIRRLIQRSEQIGQIRRHLEDRQEELKWRRRELDSLLGRITQLVSDTQAAQPQVPGMAGPPLSPRLCGCAAGDDPLEQLQQLGEASKQQESWIQRRRELRRQARLLRRRRAKHQEAGSRLKHRRRELLRHAGAEDEGQLRQRAVQAARAEVLRQEREALTREITAAIGGTCSEEALRGQLEDQGSTPLETRRDQLRQRSAALGQQLRWCFQHVGQLAEQLKALAENQELAAKRLELAIVEKRLEEAIGRWQVLAVTNRVLDAIRTTYEKQRQPETLQEASLYLCRLTQGRYRRVWTPLGEDVLRVDDAEGHWLPVEVLSRGAREQLFLSLRLALAACYARRGAPVPLVLDDVLVNFDAARAKAAAAVLRDFAAAGHQVLVFTCHEHILRLFKALHVPVGRLPDNAAADHAPVTFQQPPKGKTRGKAETGKRKADTEIPNPKSPIPKSKKGRRADDEPAEADASEPSGRYILWDDEEVADVNDAEPEEVDAEDATDDDTQQDQDDDEDEYQWEEADGPYEDEDEEREDHGTAEAA